MLAVVEDEQCLARTERVEHDVRSAPEVGLRDAMASAAERDSVASEYVTDYALTFGIVLPALKAARAADLSWSEAALEAYDSVVLANVPATDLSTSRMEALNQVQHKAAEAMYRSAGAAGVYFVRMVGPQFSQTRRVVVSH